MRTRADRPRLHEPAASPPSPLDFTPCALPAHEPLIAEGKCRMAESRSRRANTNLREPIVRLVDSGLRLSELRSEKALFDFLIDEATELSGAQRVLLVLDSDDGLHLAGSVLPHGESAVGLLTAIEPWLAETRRTRTASLRHGPEGVEPTAQRSCLIAPLIAQQELIGYLYADIEGAFGRFAGTDRDLLARLASQAAVALTNLRFSEGLERKVAERSAQLELTVQAERQRAAELAIVNSVQAALASKLDVQAIHQLVGDKVRDVFDAQSVLIGLFDHEKQIEVFTYSWEKGVYADDPPRPLNGLRRQLIATRQTLFDNHVTQETADRLEATPIGDTPMPKSAIFVPMVVGDEVKGYVSIQNIDRFEAFTDTDVRLLETLTGSLAVAFENARLFDETQRLLKETEQRNAELAVINSIQEGMAAELNFKAIVDLVGDKLREVFETGDLGIRWRNRQTGMVDYLYEYEHGVRIHPESHMPRLDSPVLRAFERREALVLNTRAEMNAAGIAAIPGTDESLSCVFVPIVGGDRLLGGIAMENYEREHAFGAAAVRLLSTVAASMGVALENARLFDETQRLLKETERRSSELAVINSIQQGMARELNFQAIVDVVGDKLRELFDTGDLGIQWRDEKTETVHHLYVYEHGQRLAWRTSPYKPEAPINKALQTGRPVVLGNRAAMDGLGLKLVPGTDASLSCVFVSVMVGERLIATISIESFEREDAFGDAEVHLLSTIGASMGVALENARLLDETQRRARESSALSDVGRDLSSSLDLATVMDSIARHARDLLRATNSAIFLPDAAGSTYRAIVALGEAADALRATVVEAGTGIIGSLLQSGQPELINDTQADPRALQIAGTPRQYDERLMVVPLLAGDQVVGAMAVWRNGGEPFESHELEFLVGLSRQATVALQNARLFNETQEALEQQTATAGILRVISESPHDIQPVFHAIVGAAFRLFRVKGAFLQIREGNAFRVMSVARHGRATTGPSPELTPLDAKANFPSQVLLGKQMLHIPDWLAIELPPHEQRVQSVEGIRSTLMLPIMQGDACIGVLGLAREEPGRFTDKEIALLRAFVDQAVIAIQNVRLFNETQEALARQTATSDVLRVISESPTDVQPVFDIIAERAAALTGARYCLVTRFDGEWLHLASLHGVNPEGAAALRGVWPQRLEGSTSIAARAIRQRGVVNVADLLAESDADYAPSMKHVVEVAGFRSGLSVPMLHDQQIVGAITVNRSETGLYPEKEVTLLQTFARQAVVAIENVRLFNETKEALEQQTASAEVLQVISGSLADAQPVFDKIAQSCRQLFASEQVGVFLVRDDGWLHVGHWYGTAMQAIARTFPRPLEQTVTAQVLRDQAPVHVADAAALKDAP